MRSLILALLALAQSPAAPVGMRALLEELGSREALARLPAPAYVLEHNSRALRPLEREGRREWLLAEPAGAGAFTRLSLAHAHGKLRLYLGAAVEPVFSIEAEAQAADPLPLPFGNGARLTLECADEPAFELYWRSYPAGTSVADWSAPGKAELDALRAATEAKSSGPEGELAYTLSLSEKIPAGDFLATDPRLCSGPRAVSALVLRVEGSDMQAAVRGLVLHLSFDGEETVVCPLETFFRATESDARIRAPWTHDFAARWLMPYAKRMDLSVENLGPRSTHVSGAVYTVPWNWDERSLHFGARWIAARGSTRLAIEGTGQLLGILPACAARAELDGAPLPLPPALERAPFRERLVFELPDHPQPLPQRAAFFYLRPGAKIASRNPQASDRESLASER